jgi:hypothetical protein
MRLLIAAPLILIAACGSADSASPPPHPAPSSTTAAAMPAATAATAVQVAIPGGTMGKDELATKICFLAPAEIEAALGFKVAAGVPQLK